MTTGPELLLEPLSTPDVMAAKMLIPFGSAADPEGQRGVHQLLASVLSRGCGPHDHLQLADLVEGSGAGLRCEAHEDGLLISLRCASSDATELMPLMAWMVTAPHLVESQITLERNLSLQALQRQREDPFHCAFDGWRQVAYGNGGYGHDPLGLETDVANLDRDALQPLAEGMKRSPAVLAVAGLWPKQLESELMQWPGFRDWSSSSGEPFVAPGVTQSIGETRRETLISQPLATEQVVIMLGQPTVPHGHDDDLPLRLLQCHLGVGMSSLLFRRLREEHGVAYDVGVHLPCRVQQAPFVMHASSGEERSELSLRLLMESWQELLSDPLSDADLDLAKCKYLGQMAHGRQTSSQRAERRVQLRGLGLQNDHDDRCRQAVESLTSTDLIRVAQEHLQAPRLSLCGPSDRLTALERVWSNLTIQGAESG